MPRNTARGRTEAGRTQQARRPGKPGERDARLQQRRLLVAREAARLLAESGLGDYSQAKLKAARRLGFRDEASLPPNTDVEQALLEHRRLFQPDSGAALQRSRRAALAAMEFFASFQPRLVGAVLEGTGDAGTPVTLHLHCDDPEAVHRFLDQHGIPASPHERSLRLDRERRARFPAWQLEADGIGFELLVLPPPILRQAPLSPVDERPMQRASTRHLRDLLGQNEDAPHMAGRP